MRQIHINEIIENIEKLCIEANIYLPCDIKKSFDESFEKETKPLAKRIFGTMIENYKLAEKKQTPVCQDTGMAMVFLKIGQDVHITGGNLTDAVNEGVRRGYINGYLRCSVVSDPLLRENTNDNTPAIITTEIVDGEKIEITVAPKGFGSENMSKLNMFNPSATKDDIVNFVVDSVLKAGSNPCPPVIVGVGIGGTADKAALISKKAMLRNIEIKNENLFYADLEKEILDKINQTNIGAQGFKGDITALSVAIETYPTHIAGLPCAVSIGCHVTRHKSVIV